MIKVKTRKDHEVREYTLEDMPIGTWGVTKVCGKGVIKVSPEFAWDLSEKSNSGWHPDSFGWQNILVVVDSGATLDIEVTNA